MKKASKARQSKPAIGQVRYSYCSQPVPDELRSTLRYVDTVDATASVGIHAYQMAVNDVYDPDITSAGNQPAYYDELNAIYNRWVVTECEYDVAITSRTVSGRMSTAVVPVTATSLVPTTFENASVLRYAKTADTTGGGPTYHIKGRVKVCDLYGIPDYQVEADDAFQGAGTASPNRRCVLAIITQTSGSSDALSLTISLKYKVRFFQPSVASLSLAAPAASAALLHPTTVTRTAPEAAPIEEKNPVCGPRQDHLWGGNWISAQCARCSVKRTPETELTSCRQ
jgi:hypothetical protein